MGRADKLLTACAIALTLLAGVSGAIAAADPGDPAASEGTSVGDSGSGGDQSAEKADHTDPHPYASADNDPTDGTQSGDVGRTTPAERKSPAMSKTAKRTPPNAIRAAITIATRPSTEYRFIFPKRRLSSTSARSQSSCPRLR